MPERTFALRRKRHIPIFRHASSGVLARFCLLAELAQHRINISLQSQFARPNALLHSLPSTLGAQPFELQMRIENKRRPGETPGRPRAARMHADDVKCLTAKAK